MENLIQKIGERAEKAVCDALKKLPFPWQHFSGVEWRTQRKEGESLGETDLIVFHPQHGIIVFEIKAGAVLIREGIWYYSTGTEMKYSPFSQARRNRFALIEKLSTKLSQDTIKQLTITHAVWFPEVNWNAALPGTEAPSRSFLLDRNSLAKTEADLLKLFSEANPNPTPWNKSQQQTLKDLLTPSCELLVPLAVQVDQSLQSLHQATEQQISTLRILRTSSRLLVEGGAGSGKTLLAASLAKEHAHQGKQVLFTCFNKQLSLHLKACLADIQGITVINFHELVRQQCAQTKIDYIVPVDIQAQKAFFGEGAADLLLAATEQSGPCFDTLIVDEGADFHPTWWLALETLGNPNFSWYCFYDKQQAIYQMHWEPPFQANPMPLDINLRNPKPIGLMASKISGFAMPAQFQTEQGIEPSIQYASDFNEMALQIKECLRQLIKKESIQPEQITILAPYKHTNQKSVWSSGLKEVQLNTELATPQAGKIRIGTIQGFKGLESDVILLVGIDQLANTHKELLYVGSTRAKACLHIFAREGIDNFLNTDQV